MATGNSRADRIKQTPLTRLRRARKRGVFDRETVYAIVDATPICHVGHLIEGRPVVTPTCHWRSGDHIYWHGSRASRMMQASLDAAVCLTVTHLDGLVLARSGFHHSANYRSAMIFGEPQIVDDPELKMASLERFVDGLFPGRWETLRPPTRKEMNATTVLTMPIEEASAKVRSGPPKEAPGDELLSIWAGEIPLTIAVDTPVPDRFVADDQPLPAHVSGYGLAQQTIENE
ncbi:MAG: pyridoxamine 5'-phosphate oxidase family protein [Pseudomonadaceae bacterium]|nr:pyridoxamine 5'-phosphate oxidase family protein [Pseudomonadaceae bacterium]